MAERETATILNLGNSSTSDTEALAPMEGVIFESQLWCSLAMPCDLKSTKDHTVEEDEDIHLIFEKRERKIKIYLENILPEKKEKLSKFLERKKKGK